MNFELIFSLFIIFQCFSFSMAIPFIRNFLNWFYTPPPSEAFMSTSQLITHRGYPVETHQVESADGYLSTLFRIPHGKFTNKRGRGLKGPVIIHHGFLCSSSDWLFLPPGDALRKQNLNWQNQKLKPHQNLQIFPAFLLADDGHDVWLGNSRGNNYSVAHVTLDPKDRPFWDFSVHEMGTYDMPAIIKYILRVTNSAQLNYMGHSMGSAIIFIALTSHSELQPLVKKIVSLSPAVYLNHMTSPGFRLTATTNGINSKISHGPLLPTLIARFSRWGPFICSGPGGFWFCSSVFSLFNGQHGQEITRKMITIITGHTPSDSSLKTFLHYSQMLHQQHQRFQQFDYGPEGNLKKYKSILPPLYNLTKINVPVYLMYGLNDILIVPEDVRRTVKELGNVRKVIEVSDPEWTHLDFTYGKHARVMVYDKIIEIFNYF